MDNTLEYLFLHIGTRYNGNRFGNQASRHDVVSLSPEVHCVASYSAMRR